MDRVFISSMMRFRVAIQGQKAHYNPLDGFLLTIKKLKTNRKNRPRPQSPGRPLLNLDYSLAAKSSADPAGIASIVDAVFQKPLPKHY